MADQTAQSSQTDQSGQANPSSSTSGGGTAVAEGGTFAASIGMAPRPHQSRDCSILEQYHLEGFQNYGVWAYRMKHMLQRDGLYIYCVTPPSTVMLDAERLGRESALTAINNNAKNAALRLLKRYKEPYRCWTKLKDRYEAFNGPRKTMLIEKIFSMRKSENVSMDTYLTDVKEVVDLLEEVDIDLPEDVVVYYTVKSLPPQYEIFKRMTLDGDRLPTYEDLESKLISVEMSLGLDSGSERTSEALSTQRGQDYRSAGSPRFQSQLHGGFQSQGSYERRPSYGFQPYGYQQYQPRPAQQYRPPTHQLQNLRVNQGSSNYQPRFKSRGPEKPRPEVCNFCGEAGHLERECEIKAHIDRAKDWEHRIIEKKKTRRTEGHVHQVDTSWASKAESIFARFKLCSA